MSFRRGRRAIVFAVIFFLLSGGAIALLFRQIQNRSNDAGVAKELRRNIAAARLAFERSDLHNAARILDQILETVPTNSEALVLRGQIHREEGDSDSAVTFWSQVPEADQENCAVARFLQATVAFEQRLLSKGEELLHLSKRLNPQYLPPRERLVRLHVLLLQTTQARQELKELRELRSLTVHDLAQYRMSSGIIDNPQSVIPLLQQYLHADPAHKDCHIALIHYMKAADRWDEALKVLMESKFNWRANAELVALMAEIHLDRGDSKSAVNVLAERQRGVMSLEIQRAAGLLAYAVSDWALAVKCLEPIYLTQPEDTEAGYQFGIALERSGRPLDASRHLKNVAALQSAFTNAERLFVVDDVNPVLAGPIVQEIIASLMDVGFQEEAAMWSSLLVSWNPENRDYIEQLQQLDSQSSSNLAESKSIAVPSFNLTEQELETLITAVLEKQTDTNLQQEASTIRLDDEHERVGLDFQYFNGESEQKFLLESLGGGVAVLDLDRDAWPDLFFPQGCRLPVEPQDRTYTNVACRNTRGDHFQRIEQAAGLDDHYYGQGCAAADFDNDGFPDLAVGSYGPLSLYHNNGDGTFSEISETAGVKQSHWTSSLAWGDVDLDGDLDLYLANYLLEAEKVCRDNEGRARTCNPENYPAEADVLFLNQGDFTFKDGTIAAGITAEQGKGIGVIMSDLDSDGKIDIYVANDGVPNHLYHNLSENGAVRFEEIGITSGSALRRDGAAQASMGIACADFTGNGRPDLYVTHFYGDYSTLYRNEGDLVFSDVTSEYGIAAATNTVLSWGSQAVDLDLDGWEDIVTANGHIDDLRDQGVPWKMPAQVFQNHGGRFFADVSRTSGSFFQSAQLGRGVARIDWNCDGLPDIVLVSQDRPVAMLTNTTEKHGNWIAIRLSGIDSNRDAIGARVVLRMEGRTMMKEWTGSSGFAGTNDSTQIIGIGDHDTAAEIEIIWPSGQRQILRNVPANTFLIARELAGVDTFSKPY